MISILPGELKKVYAFDVLWNKSMRPIFNTEMLIYQSKANLDESIFLLRSLIFKTQQLKNANEEFVWE